MECSLATEYHHTLHTHSFSFLNAEEVTEPENLEQNLAVNSNDQKKKEKSDLETTSRFGQDSAMHVADPGGNASVKER